LQGYKLAASSTRAVAQLGKLRLKSGQHPAAYFTIVDTTKRDCIDAVKAQEMEWSGRSEESHISSRNYRLPIMMKGACVKRMVATPSQADER